MMKRFFLRTVATMGLILPFTACTEDGIKSSTEESIANLETFEVDGIHYKVIEAGKDKVEVTYTEEPEYSGDITIPAKVSFKGYPFSVIAIGRCAFEDCTGLTSISIPNSVTEIGWFAFSGCTGLSSVTIPNSVTEIGGNAFENTYWYQNQPNGVIYINNVLYKHKGRIPKNTSINIKYGTVSISGCAFLDIDEIGFFDKNLKSVTIPNSVTKIGNQAFYTCSGFTSITIPNSVREIGISAFTNCLGLESATIGNGVTTIEYTFYGCENLKSVTIGNNVTEIGGWAFYRCKSLKTIYCQPQTPPTIDSDTFEGVQNATLYVPAGSKEAYQRAEYWSGFSNIVGTYFANK